MPSRSPALPLVAAVLRAGAHVGNAAFGRQPHEGPQPLGVARDRPRRIRPPSRRERPGPQMLKVEIDELLKLRRAGWLRLLRGTKAPRPDTADERAAERFS